MTSLAALILDSRPRAPKRRAAEEAQLLDSPAELCLDCGATKTPLWRWDPTYDYGVRRLCNRCGCKAARLARKQHGASRRASRESVDGDDEEWGGAWRTVSPSSSDGEAEAQLRAAAPEPTGRQMRPRRVPSLKEEAPEADAWVAVETVYASQCQPTPSNTGRRGRPLGAQNPSRRQMTGGTRKAAGKDGKENRLKCSSFRKRPRKQSSPYRAL